MGFIDRAQLDRAELARTLATDLLVGRHPKTGDPFVVNAIDRFSGTYVLGVAGSGKSGLLENLIVEDIKKGQAVIVIDPHGDLINECVASMPPEHLARTYFLDMLDEGHPYGINFFNLAGTPRTLKEKGQVVDRVTHVFNVLWPETKDHANLPMYVRTAAIALISNPGMTLAHMRQFLTDKPFRDTLLKNVADPTVHAHWAEHDRLGDTAKQNNIQPLLRRLGSLFIGHDLIQQILGQPTTISFRKAIENREIIFIKLPTTDLEEQAGTLGKVIVAQISAALFSFADLPEKERPGFGLYIDEFQNFVSKDIERFITEGRKFGIRLTVAHQLRAQLDKDLKSATAAMRTKICFQTEPADSSDAAQYFPAPDDGRLEEVEAHATAALLKDPGDDPHVRQFTDMYLRPLQSQRKGGKIEIKQPKLDLFQVAIWGNQEAQKRANKAGPPTVEDPTQYLDDLLRDVMKFRNPNIAIPPKAVIGFANCGGFYNAVKRLQPCLELTGGYVFPPQLVDGDHWLRAPKNDQEQFLHCVFTLRQAMRYLAAHPLGKKAQATTTAVAQWLTQLPRRHALLISTP